MFNRTNKDAMDIIVAENKRLKQENYVLKSKLDEVEKYKNEYRELIDKIKVLKKDYEQQIKAYENIRIEFEKEAERIKKSLRVK